MDRCKSTHYKKSNYLKNKVKMSNNMLLLLVLLIFILSILDLTSKPKNEGMANLLRVESASQKNYVKEAFKQDEYDMEEGFYKYALVGLDGSVKFSVIEDIKTGEKINIETEIGYDNLFMQKNEDLIRYSTPLVIENTQEAILIIDMPKSLIEGGYKYKKYIPLWLILGLIILVVIGTKRFINKDIILPINEMHESSKFILKGNYDHSINYDYDGEIGEFCHDFEFMRDELRISKEKEENLKKNEKELLACISHDLKTPLASIIGYVEGIRDGIVKDEVGIRRYSNIVLRKSLELSKLIDDILEQSKTELNELSINRKEVYFDDYFTQVLEDASLDVANYNMGLQILGEIPRVLVSIDERRINQVINNIVGNSIKYSKSGDRIEVFFEDCLDKIIVHIKDFGRGVSLGDIPFVFDKFYRADKHRDTNIRGSGLGLSIAKYIIESHGGEIKCTSSGTGTTISFTIMKEY